MSQPEAAARARAINLVVTPSEDVARMLDQAIRTATPAGGYCMGIAVVACHQAGLMPTAEFFEHLRLQTSLRIGESVVERWVSDQIRRGLGAPF